MSSDYTNPNLTPDDYWWHDVDTAKRCPHCLTRLEWSAVYGGHYPCPICSDRTGDQP